MKAIVNDCSCGLKRGAFALVGLVTFSLTAGPAADEPWKRNAPITGAYDKSLAVTCQNGTFVGKVRGAVVEHLGIPYAMQPVGALRWTAPQLAPKDDGIYEAYDFGPRALQPGKPQRVPMGEDCLVLNVYRRVNAPKGPLPVMVWIHGGAWIAGAGSDDIYDGRSFLADEPGVILVTINYRLGAMGYLPGLDSAPEYRTSANLGLLDAACAFKWVKRNIAAFGGDPENITAFGESAGAGQTSFLPFVAERGSVHKFIVQSGSIAMHQTPQAGRETTRQFLAAAGAKDVRGLLSLSSERLLAAMMKIKYNSFPTADGVTIPTDVWSAYPAAVRGCRLMIGTNERENNLLYVMKGGFRKATELAYRDWTSYLAANAISGEDWQGVRTYFSSAVKPELSHGEKTMLFVGDVFFREGAIRHAEVSSAAGIPTYVYLMTQPTAGHPDIGCCHATDIGYVFNNPAFEVGGGASFLKKERPMEKACVFNPELCREMRRMWFAFAKTGDPSTPEHVWTSYDSARHPTMLLGPRIGMADDPDGDVRRCLAPMLRYSWETTFTHGGLLDTWHVAE